MIEVNRNCWKVVYISPERIEDYNDCYRVDLNPITENLNCTGVSCPGEMTGYLD